MRRRGPPPSTCRGARHPVTVIRAPLKRWIATALRASSVAAESNSSRPGQRTLIIDRTGKDILARSCPSFAGRVGPDSSSGVPAGRPRRRRRAAPSARCAARRRARRAARDANRLRRDEQLGPDTSRYPRRRASTAGAAYVPGIRALAISARRPRWVPSVIRGRRLDVPK